MIRRTTNDAGEDVFRLSPGTWVAVLTLVLGAITTVVGSTVVLASRASAIETKLDAVVSENLPKRTLTLELALQSIGEQIKKHEERLEQRDRAAAFGGKRP